MASAKRIILGVFILAAAGYLLNSFSREPVGLSHLIPALFAYLVALPIVLIFIFKTIAASLRGEGQDNSKIQADEMSNDQKPADKLFVPKTPTQELMAQLVLALKFGAVVQIGLAITLVLTSIFQPTMLNNSSTAPFIYGSMNVLPILYGYRLLENRMLFRKVIVMLSSFGLGATLFILYVLSQQVPKTVSFTGEMHTIEFIFGMVQLLGMIIFAPLITLIVYPLMRRY